MKVLVGAFNQEKALVGAFSVITSLQMNLFEAVAVELSVTCAVTETITACTRLALHSGSSGDYLYCVFPVSVGINGDERRLRRGAGVQE